MVKSSIDYLNEDTVRISFAIPKDLQIRMNNLVMHGARSGFMRRLIEMAVETIESAGTDRYTMVGAILTGDINPFSIRRNSDE